MPESEAGFQALPRRCWHSTQLGTGQGRSWVSSAVGRSRESAPGATAEPWATRRLHENPARLAGRKRAVDGNHPNFIVLSTVALRMDCGRGKRHNSEISVAVDVYVHTFYICRDISVNLCIYIYLYICSRAPPPK